MPADTYIIFNDMLEDADVGFSQAQLCKWTRIRVSWISGARHTKEIPTLIEAQINPEYGSELIDSYRVVIPLWSDRLVHAMHQAGVSNFDTYDAIIRDPRTGLQTNKYKAVNVLGLIDCTDLSQSRFDPRSEYGAREFTELVIDPKKAHGFKMFRLAERPT